MYKASPVKVFMPALLGIGSILSSVMIAILFPVFRATLSERIASLVVVFALAQIAWLVGYLLANR